MKSEDSTTDKQRKQSTTATPNGKPSSIDPNGKREEQFLIVGIGASAGGIQALKEFFSIVNGGSGMAYVVILHLSPEHESKLAEVLQVVSPIPVTQVQNREKIEPNHVYVIPPNQNLSITDGHLQLTTMIGLEERRSPVDLFFRTLAETNETRAVSVILSGTGADGSIGIKRIKEYGGVAFAQDPNQAEYSDMPTNAIATGMVDYILPVAQIPAKITSYKQHLSTVKMPEPSEEPAINEKALLDIFTQLRIRTGQDFSNYKRATILRRIERRLGLRELPGLAEYAHYLREEPEEVHKLMKDLLISVTNFFRDPEFIDALALNVIPKILDSKNEGDSIRVWVPGCATGEEAYSLGMIFSEFVASDPRELSLQVFATDLDHDAIQVAREGYYKDAEVADVSPERLRQFFKREADGYRVRRELREMILFAGHNVIKDPPFSHLDLISCRNLLIYLNRSAQGRVLEILHFALNPSGYLFLGASESIEGAKDLFSVYDKDHHIFRSRPVQPRAFPIPEVPLRPTFTPSLERDRDPEEKRVLERFSYADLHQRLLEEYGPPSVIVNEEYDVVHLSDRAGIYLQISGGALTHNLLKMIRPELRLDLRTALYQALVDRTNVETGPITFGTESDRKTVNMLVRPVLRKEDTIKGFVLVLFEEVAERSAADQAPIRPGSAEPIVNRLEEELVHSKAQLRATVEQYEIQQEELRASNEELQAMNEELRSSAEELETSKEELQSVNEELTTVNQELKIKIEELSQANNNFQNLMNSTDIGTIFLDRSLRVRQFTPSAVQIFNLIPGDTGRPLMDITSKLELDNLLDDIQQVLAKLRTIEREVETPDGRSFVMRLSPYRTLEDKIDGVVITLVDVSEQARARDFLSRTYEELERRVEVRTKELAAANDALRREMAERAQVEDSRLQLLSQLVNAQEDERRRFALDLHDQLGQQLTSLKIKLEGLGRQVSEDTKLAASFEDLQKILKQLNSDVDFLAWQMRPVSLDDLGLSAALRNYVQQWSEHFDVKAEFRASDSMDGRFLPQIETNLYRIAQEALNNCAKHARCTSAEVLLERRDDHAVLIIADNGDGFEPEIISKDGRWGLVGMHERARLIGGTVEIESSKTEGTTIYVRVPVDGQGVVK